MTSKRVKTFKLSKIEVKKISSPINYVTSQVRLKPKTQKKRLYSADKTEMIWTQGRIYDFHAGDTIYNTKLAYQKWEEAVNHILLYIQVQSSSPSEYVTYETIETKRKGLRILQQKRGSKSKENTAGGLVVKKQRLEHGLVKFRAYRPNKENKIFKECELLECAQDDFVAFLQTGIIHTKDNKQLNFFAENA
ncbi:MAG: hypothetical protein D8M57_18135 [Candidatus Scalindua sp. AMX11]|nr:MAG: hypothetical protein DWQ00_08235 [Candidatus Scalindua sp.]NOG83298.1 hypothetical protein [Planctomycetota bacterium]RZV76802.1 MAG: hypothetical protein EX341_12270 [Candidatus Scalindua sp. SCAELEC01]TDE63443.1 MAG: hypothetical protein D8M57_18135 [Candidatus Scalindua sp. AMX11]GJQ57486.1 MAG: hypothetical protein SCALA701_02870 [Candidatus Scalindua sp.]